MKAIGCFQTLGATQYYSLWAPTAS